MAIDPSGPSDPRVLLALHRTLLAWTRTALGLMGLGFVVARLGLFLRELAMGAAMRTGETGAPPAAPGPSLWLGTGVVVLAVVVQVLAFVEYRQALGRLHRGEAITEARWSLADLTGLVVVALGVAMVLSLLRLG